MNIKQKNVHVFDQSIYIYITQRRARRRRALYVYIQSITGKTYFIRRFALKIKNNYLVIGNKQMRTPHV